MERTPMLRNYRTDRVKLTILPKTIYKFNELLIKIPTQKQFTKLYGKPKSYDTYNNPEYPKNFW